MAWTCPDCGRSFRHPAQSHSCMIVPIEKHFSNRPPALWDAYEKILLTVKGFGPVQVNILNGAITMAAASTFLAFKTRKDYAELEILSDREINEFPIYKTFRVSRSRVALFIRIQGPEEVDRQLIEWLRNAYNKVGA